MKKGLYVIIIIITFSYLLASCYREEYHHKIFNGFEDQDVKIVNKLASKNSGEVDLSFVRKQIPYEIEINADSTTYAGDVGFSGSLEEGSIDVKFLNGQETLWDLKIDAGKINLSKTKFDLYAGKYKLKLTFLNAKQGNLTIKFRTLN